MDINILLAYSLFLFITLIFIIFVLRGCYFVCVIKQDPIKSIKPKFKSLLGWYKDTNDREKEGLLG